MKKHLIYCSACDREVEVMLVQQESAGTIIDVICTEIGKHCTGAMCPVCAKPPETIREQLKDVRG
jgi:hypothetical protein